MAVQLSPIMDALYHGQTADAERLADEAGADHLSVHEAAALGSVDRLTRLLDDHPALTNAWSADGFQPLQLASFFGRRAAVELLLERGAEIDTSARHQFHVAALHAALAGPDPSIARLLIGRGADVNARQQGGVTPLDAAAQNGDAEMIQLLLDHGADPAARDDRGRTAADFAREANKPAVLPLLGAQ
jgi:ankyrin repeat protein